MNSLFLKIFLWFWLAMALVGAALVFSIFYIPAGEADKWAHTAIDTLTEYGPEAARVFEEEGPAALRQYLARLSAASGARLVLLDNRGDELSGRPAMPAQARLARRAIRSGSGESFVAPRLVMVASPVNGPSGRKYALVGAVPRRLARTEFQPWDLGLRILAIVTTAGLVCYGLARYLTAPLLKLRGATRKLAQGELDSRVDASVRKRADEYGDLAQDFDHMADRIEQLVVSQRRLLGDISHELRSPLSRLNVALELARKNAGEDAAGYLRRIEIEAERMNQLIGQLLTLSRFENEAPKAVASRVSLDDLLRSVVADADFEATGQKRRVQLVSADRCQINGVSELLRSAIENVVRNAIRYAPENTTVDVSLTQEPGGPAAEAVVRIRDHGPGVSEAGLEQIFEPFYREGDARDRQSGGTGLGLAIAGRAVRLHGGSITARNAPGGGLLVEIRLPLAQ